jgi:hypothetical protein
VLTNVANVDGKLWVRSNGRKWGDNRRVPLGMGCAEEESRVQSGDYPSEKGPANERNGGKVVSGKVSKDKFQHI